MSRKQCRAVCPQLLTTRAQAQDTLGDGQLLFLVLHALRASPFRNAADALEQVRALPQHWTGLVWLGPAATHPSRQC